MRILIVERHALMRAGLAGLIQSVRPEWQLVPVADLVEARQCINTDHFTVILLGSRVLHSDDLHDLADLRRDRPTLKVIVRSDTPHRDAILYCLKAGAHGCITEATSPSDLILAIESVVSGLVAVPAEMTDLEAMRRSGDRPCENGYKSAIRLTPRQSEVLGLLGRGCSTKEIARSLDLGVGTIKTHLASIYRTMGARNRVEAALMATGGQQNASH